jgi:hypothetical protein
MSTGLLPIHMIVDLRSPDMNRNINEFTGFNENENHVEILDLLLERYPNSIMATEIINNMIPLQVAAYTTKSENGIVTPIIASIFHLLVDKTTKASKSSFTDAETTIDNVVTTYKDRNGLTAYDWSWKNVNYYCSRCGMEEDSATTTTVTRRMPMKCNCNQAVSVTVNVIHPLLRKEICNHIQVIDAAKKEKRRGRNNDTATEAAEGTIVAEAEAAKATEATAVETATIRYESDKDFMLIPSSSPVPSPCWASSSSDVLSSTTSEQRSVAAAAPPTLLVESKKTTRSASFARIQRRLAQQQQLQQQQQAVEVEVEVEVEVVSTNVVSPHPAASGEGEGLNNNNWKTFSSSLSTLSTSPPSHTAQVQQQQPHVPSYNRYFDKDDLFYSFDTLQYSESFSTCSHYVLNRNE